MPVDKRRRCNEPKEARVLKCLFEFLAKWPSVRSAGHSSQPESNEITRIYILWFTSLSSAFSAPSPLGVLVCRPSTTHYGLVFSFVSSSIPLLLPSPLPPRLVLLFVHRAVGEPTVKLRIPFLWESWQIIAIFEKFGTIFFQGDFIEKKALAPDLVYGLFCNWNIYRSIYLKLLLFESLSVLFQSVDLSLYTYVSFLSFIIFQHRYLHNLNINYRYSMSFDILYTGNNWKIKKI